MGAASTVRTTSLIILFGLVLGNLRPVLSQPPALIEAARRAAYPQLPDQAPLLSSSRHLVDSAALGCDLIFGSPMPDPLEVYRLAFQLEGAAYAVHISADGSLTQVCDERYPNLGAGVQSVAREYVDSDGDALADPRDDCPLIAGLYAADQPGCPQPSSADRDGDGSPDRLDRCPDQAGSAAAEGCAILIDHDGDGVPDDSDICLADFGVIRPDFALGCPADGSGASSRRRASDEACLAAGPDLALYADRDESAPVIKRLDAAPVLARSAARDWYQVESGWLRATDLQLKGACYNIPLVNPGPGGATGCFMRARGDYVNVRQAPNGKLAARLLSQEQVPVLGKSASGDWLFYRAGWVSRSVLELAGSCEGLPTLNPAQVASGTIRFCPPDYAGLLPPRIGIGNGKARVASDSLANRLRAEPDYLAEQVGEIPPRTIIDAVLDGPACQPPFVWWQVEVAGQVGWTVESDVNAYHYYLEPTANLALNRRGHPPSLSETVIPASKRFIHSANLNSFDTVASLPLPAPSDVFWSARQTLLAAVSERGDIALFNAPDFQPISVSLSLAVSAIAISPDERWLAAGDRDGGVALVDLSDNSGAARSIPLGWLPGPIVALRWNHAGDKLAAISGAESLKLTREAGALEVWQIDSAAPASSEVSLRYRYPYPLTAVAYSRADRWLAVSGESTGDGRAALWVYDSETGDLVFRRALVPMRGSGLVVAPPSSDLGDFVYSSGDSLYQLALESGDLHRFYHQAGAQLSGVAFRPQFLAGAEGLMALAAQSPSGEERLHLTNALSPHAPSRSLSLAASAVAFSPDGRLLAIAETDKDRVLVLGVAAGQ